ncbi:hypothetical protein GCM10010954_36440 [Halobacillus andaensis]|uniref:Uncharacterized protein n=1 Tax=Halobacillus andaensis TaxID=1176239 RepID=A0A917BBF6_HALAA|nr:hypothetical protein [Halobacillus andaensis]GGF34096.1 hypothetical protein GCM10010954_36440 [Halobacillus andaensis]
MIVILNHQDARRAQVILSVQRPAYEIEAEIIHSKEIPRLYDTIKDIQLSELAF